MRIGIDLRPFYTGSRFRGIGVYARNLIAEMLRLDQENEYHFLNVYGDFPNDVPMDNRCFVHSYYTGPIVVDCGERNLYRVPELENVRKAQVKNFLSESKIDVMLFPSPNEYGNMFKADWFQSVRTLGIVYDIIPLLFPNQFLFDPVYTEDYFKSIEFVKELDCLLAISQNTRDDVIKELCIPEDRVQVISSGINERFLNVKKEDTISSYIQNRYEDYFLFAGGIDFKKNIENLIRAFAKLSSSTRKNTKLVIAGKASPDTIQHYKEIARQCHISRNVICTGFVSDEELMGLYCGATALVFPSLYEGFGLPVIEAMACGTPVITSNTSSLKEIAEGYGLLVDPESTSELTDAMQYVLTNPDELQAMTQRAISHAHEFTWERVAQRTLLAINSIEKRKSASAPVSGTYYVADDELAAIAREHYMWGVKFSAKLRGRIVNELLALESCAQFPVYPYSKRIFFDVTVLRGWLQNNYITGIGRVCLNLYFELCQMADVVAVSTENVNGKFVFYPVDMNTCEIGEESLAIRSGDIYFMPEFQIRGIQIPEDYPHPSYLRAMGVKTYAIIYDILPLLMPQYFEEKTNQAFLRYVQDILQGYDGVLTDSKAVSDELIQYYVDHELQTDHMVKIGWFHNGVDVSPESVDKNSVDPCTAEFFLGQTFLMVGTIEPRKGHQLVFEAFEELWRNGCRARLCFIGRVGWNMQDFIEKIKAHEENGHRFLFLEGVSDQTLHFAYEHSAALIQASAGEGFGLPLIEAGQYGLPIICSDIPVFHEVAGENAIYFCHTSVKELRKVVCSFEGWLKEGKIPESSKIEYCSWTEAACRVANIILANTCWYKEILPDGKVNAVEQKADVYHPLSFVEMNHGQGATDEEYSQKEKSILLVHPNNFLRGGQGENNRTLAIAKLLKEAGYEIDLLSFENFAAHSSFTTFADDNAEGLIRNLYLYDFRLGYKEDYASKRRFTMNQCLQDWTRPGMHILFEEAISQHNYAAIGVFYTYLANLLIDAEVKAKKWYFMEDSMFIQQFSWDGPKSSIGKIMDEEIEKLQVFDEFFCISYDEKILYEKLIGRSMNFLPHVMPANSHVVTTLVENRKYDVAFVGANNQFNVEGLQWFVDKVYPLLNQGVKVVFAGAAAKEVKNIPSTITVIPFAKDLDALFDDVKVSICPMFHGTGMKIKVVEAMAYGIPIVCNERGVDGLPDKMMSGCIVTNDEREFADAINLLVRDTAFYQEKSKRIKAYYRTIFERGQYIKLFSMG